MFSEPECPSVCPGCKHKRLTYAESIEQKYQFLKNKLAIWSSELHRLVEVSEENRMAYRKKVCLYALSINNTWQFGLIFRKNFISIPQCPIHHAFINTLGDLLATILPHNNFPLKHFMVSGQQVMLVLKTNNMPDISWLTGDIQYKLNQIGVEGLWMHLFPSAGFKIIGKNNFHLLFGKPFSVDSNGMIYGPLSFQQIQPELYHNSLSIASDFFASGPNDFMLDLYCGNGNSLKKWESFEATLFGVELNGEAVECCLQNVKNATVLRGKCRDRIPQINQRIQNSTFHQHLLYINPPRTGIEEEISAWICNSFRPDRIAYLSCSAGTLARDLIGLCNSGYKVVSILPYDFFPFTHHVECLVLLILQQ